PFITLEAVARDTPAFSATLFNVTRPPRGSLSAMTSPLPGTDADLRLVHVAELPSREPALTGTIEISSLNHGATFSAVSCHFLRRGPATVGRPEADHGGHPHGSVRHAPGDAARLPSAAVRTRRSGCLLGGDALPRPRDLSTRDRPGTHRQRPGPDRHVGRHLRRPRRHRGARLVQPSGRSRGR